jgi:hypothetical protein
MQRDREVGFAMTAVLEKGGAAGAVMTGIINAVLLSAAFWIAVAYAAHY